MNSKKNLRYHNIAIGSPLISDDHYIRNGQRVSKKVLSDLGVWEETTYYIRDAQGNVMAVYKHTQPGGTPELRLEEMHIYGSSRLGMTSIRNNEMITAANPTDDGVFTRSIGETRYELSNHLGNVLSVITDIKIARANGANLDYYEAQVISYTDYYPFGSPMDNANNAVADRNWSGGYRFGFNGMEKTDEINGSGNHYTTEWRELDTRLGGRWWSPDPIVKPWESPYAGFANNPIYFSDPSGLDPDKPISNPQNGDKHGNMTYDGELKAWVLPEVTVTADKSPSAGSQAAKGAAVPAAQLWRDGAIRNNYYRPMVNDFKQLYQAGKLSDGTYSMLRYQAQKATKMQLSTMGQAMSEVPPFGKPLAQQKALAEGIANGTTQMPKGAMATRGSTTKIATAAQVGGKVLVVAGAVMSVHHVITADDKGLAISQEAGGYAGAWAGAEGGAAAGAVIGAFFGGVGAAPGALIGGFIGGIGGYFGGYEVGGAIYEATKE